MSKYKVIMRASNGDEWEEDGLFDTEEEAQEHGEYVAGCAAEGAEVLNMSNPGDYPIDPDTEIEFEVVEVDD